MSASIYGNYHDYSSKRPSHRDPRLELLPTNFFQDKTVLDIGCNEGWVTCTIAQSGAKRVVGVDIDESLIRAAWSRRRKVWSVQSPLSQSATNEPLNPNATAKTNGKKRKRDHEDNHGITERNSEQPRVPTPGYFPASLPHSFGPLAIPTAASDLEEGQFPHNVAFRTANWATDGIHEDQDRYDVVIAFSITKWIHLHGLDVGLRNFFRRIFSVLRAGGVLVLEPQPWESYAKSARFSSKLKENYHQLVLRPTDFPRLLREIGFKDLVDLGEAGEGGFRRPIQLYQK